MHFLVLGGMVWREDVFKTLAGEKHGLQETCILKYSDSRPNQDTDQNKEFRNGQAMVFYTHTLTIT